MARSVRLLSAILFLLVLAAPVRAAQVPFTGTLEVEIGDLEPIPFATLKGTLEAVSPRGRVQIPAGAFSTAATRTVADSPFVSAIQLDASNLTGTLSFKDAPGREAPIFAGRLPFTGAMRFQLVGGLGLPDVSLPFALGTLSPVSGYTSTTGGSVFFSLSGTFDTFFTTGTYIVTGTPSRTAMGSRQTTTTPDGDLASRTLQLVSPIQIFRVASDGGEVDVRTLAGFGRLTLSFVPEPAPLALQGAAAAVLLGLALRRRRR